MPRFKRQIRNKVPFFIFHSSFPVLLTPALSNSEVRNRYWFCRNGHRYYRKKWISAIWKAKQSSIKSFFFMLPGRYLLQHTHFFFDFWEKKKSHPRTEDSIFHILTSTIMSISKTILCLGKYICWYHSRLKLFSSQFHLADYKRRPLKDLIFQ